mgnify:CR=1 FL=1
MFFFRLGVLNVSVALVELLRFGVGVFRLAVFAEVDVDLKHKNECVYVLLYYDV